MAVEVQHKFDMTRSSEYLMNPLDVFADPVLDVRHEHRPIDSMVADMLSKPDGKSIKGQISPITCRKNSKGFFTIICGRRRWESINFINKNNLTPVPMSIRVVYKQANDIEALAMALTENDERADLSPVDYGYTVKQYERFGKDEKWMALNGGFFPRLAERVADNEKHPELKKAIKQIKKWRALVDVSPEIEKAVVDGKLTETQAIHLTKLEKEQQETVLSKAEKGTLKPADLRAPSDKPVGINKKQIREELDGIVAEWAAVKDVPKALINAIQKLRDRL